MARVRIPDPRPGRVPIADGATVQHTETRRSRGEDIVTVKTFTAIQRDGRRAYQNNETGETFSTPDFIGRYPGAIQ